MKSVIVTCNVCEGVGVVDDGPHCTIASCDSCGGCYREHSCEECEGVGEITSNVDDCVAWFIREQANEIRMLLRRLAKYV